MNILMKWLDEMDLEEIKETFDEELFFKIKEENLLQNVQFLLDEQIFYVKDILIHYLDLFIFEPSEFQTKFKKLKNVYGENYINIIGNDLSILEKMYDE